MWLRDTPRHECPQPKDNLATLLRSAVLGHAGISPAKESRRVKSRRRTRPVPVPEQPISRGPQALALGSLGLAVVVLFGVYPLAGGDLNMHLLIGWWIWVHGTVPRVIAWSFVTEHAPFIAHSWLGEPIFYGIEDAAGTVGFMLLKLAILGTALAVDLATARLLKAS
jgi:hypothetical protein